MCCELDCRRRMHEPISGIVIEHHPLRAVVEGFDGLGRWRSIKRQRPVHNRARACEAAATALGAEKVRSRLVDDEKALAFALKPRRRSHMRVRLVAHRVRLGVLDRHKRAAAEAAQEAPELTRRPERHVCVTQVDEKVKVRRREERLRQGCE